VVREKTARCSVFVRIFFFIRQKNLADRRILFSYVKKTWPIARKTGWGLCPASLVGRRPKNLDRLVLSSYMRIYEEKERRDDDAAPAGREPSRYGQWAHLTSASQLHLKQQDFWLAFRISAPSEAAGFLVGLPHLSSI
jgi:hypothetical protein